MSVPEQAPGYVAMGSSFAAGPGLPSRAPGSPRRAGRSTGNYAHLVAAARGFDLRDVTFSGATTGDILTSRSAGRPAQLDAVTAATRLVTITAGGNDVGYLPRLTLASLPWPAPALPPVPRRLAALGDPDATAARFRQFEQRFGDIAARLRERAPQARVVVVDYLSVLPPDGPVPGPPPPAEIAEWGRSVAARLAAATQAAATAAGWTYVAASAASAGHHAWSGQPWTRRFHLTLRGGAPYHPNAAGMAAVAGLVLGALATPAADDDHG